MDVKKKIEELKKERGWSTYKLCQEANLTQSTINNMFTRNTEPSLQTLVAICDAFGITLSQLFSEGQDLLVLTEFESELLENVRSLSDDEKKLVFDIVKKMI